jgi:hypothetical protein
VDLLIQGATTTDQDLQATTQGQRGRPAHWSHVAGKLGASVHSFFDWMTD